MKSLYRSPLSKIFLISYFIIFFTILFLKDSAIFYILSGNTINKIYYLMILIGIVLNLIIIFYLGLKGVNNFNALMGVLFSLIFIIPLLFSVKVLSPIYFLFILMILNSKVINPKSFIKVDFYMRLCLMISIILLMAMHILPAIVSYRGAISRYNIGFSGPNALSVIVLSVFLSYYIMKYKENIRVLPIIIIIVVYVIDFFLTNTRQLQVLGFIFLLFYIISKVHILKPVVHFISNWLVWLSVGFSSFVSIAFICDPDINTPFFYWLNSISSDRLVIEAQTLIDYPVRLMGYTSMPLLNLKGENIDNFLANSMIHCGIIGFIIVIIIIIILGLQSIKFGNISTNVCFILIMLAFITISTDELYAPLIYIAALANYKKESNSDDVQIKINN